MQTEKDISGALDRFRGCLLGLAVGDALGTTVEFAERGTFPQLTDIVGGGPFNLEPGEWTDDTSMALCLATSLVEKGGFDALDQIERYYRWWKEGYLSSTGRCFDIGRTTRLALRQFEETRDPFTSSTDPHSAGNGSLMRLAPIPMWFYPDAQSARHYAIESSRTTHGAIECLEACGYFAQLLVRALSGLSKDQLLSGVEIPPGTSENIRKIMLGSYRVRSEIEIQSSGYVVHTLEAALWSFYHTDTFSSAVLRASNLGYDADTTAAVCGQIAGAYYGKTQIPSAWLTKLAMREEIESLAEKLFRHGKLD